MRRPVFFILLSLFALFSGSLFAVSPQGGSPVPTFVFRFTGNPVPPDFIRQEITDALGSLYDVSKVSIQPLLPDQSQALLVPATCASGKRCGSAAVLAENQPVPKMPGAFLLFSDHPEVVHHNGLLFQAGILRMHPVRLNYYHQNADGDPERAFIVQIFNPNATPATLHVIKATAGPSASIMETGHKATLLFLNRSLSNLGTLVTVPPESSLALSYQTARGGELVTGFLQIEELTGHPLFVGVVSEKPRSALKSGYPFLTSTDTHARGAYDIPHLYFSTNYQVGQHPRTIPLGDLPLANLNPGEPLKGEYSMIWEGDIRLINPMNAEAQVPFYFEPRGGPATGTFFLNGSLFEEGYSPPYKAVLITQVKVKPLSRITLHFLSMPEGGSSYPINLIVGEAGGKKS